MQANHLGSLDAHLGSPGSSTATSISPLVSLQCLSGASEYLEEAIVDDLLNNRKKARLRVKNLMRCPKFSISDHAVVMVVVGLCDENLETFALWNSKIQKAVTHFSRPEGVVRNVVDFVRANHLTEPLDNSSPDV